MVYCSFSNLYPVAWVYSGIGGASILVADRFRPYVYIASCLCFQAVIYLSLVVPSLAASSAEEVPDWVAEYEAATDPSTTEPSTVYIVSDDVDVGEFLDSPGSYEVYSVDADTPAPAAVGDGFPFFGSNWAVGTVSGLGDCTLLWPSDRGEGYIGLDAAGRLFNVSATSITGVMYDSSGIAYTVSFSSFSLPRYRLADSGSYTYQDLYFTPAETNVVLPDGVSPTYSVSELLPWVSLLLLGGIWLCCLRK